MACCCWPIWAPSSAGSGGNAWQPLPLLGDVLLVLALPFFMMLTAQSAILYFQHTRPRVPWFGPGDDGVERVGPEALTVHVCVPAWVGSLTHDLFEHHRASRRTFGSVLSAARRARAFERAAG